MTPKSDDPIQEQLIKARRDQILDAATTVFAQKGFHRATIRDVATAAGIADGTIYNYFDNKTALLLGIMDRLNQFEFRQQAYEEAVHSDVRGFIRHYMRQRFETITQVGFETLQVLLSEILVDGELRELYYKQIIEPTYTLTESYLQTWAAQGLIRLSETRLSMRLIAGLVLGLIVLRIMGDSELQSRWDDLPDLIADLILNGVEDIQGGQP